MTEPTSSLALGSVPVTPTVHQGWIKSHGRFLTQTLLKQLEKDPATYYLRELVTNEDGSSGCPSEPQTYPMAVGSAFDALVKNQLALATGRPCPSIDVMLSRIEPSPDWDPTLRDRAITEGRRLLKVYLRLGCLAKILEEGLDEVDLEPEGVEVPDTHRSMMGRRVAGVPLRGHPDARITTREGLVYPLDWKVTGANTRDAHLNPDRSPKQVDGVDKEPLKAPSPVPGYRRLYDTKIPLSHLEAPHDRAGDCFGAIHEDWATQLVTYLWLLRPGTARHPTFQDGFGAIDQLIVHPDGRVRVAQHRCKLSGAFQETVRQRYVDAWERVQNQLDPGGAPEVRGDGAKVRVVPPLDPVLLGLLRGLR